jgi:hypothetical protein
MTFPFGASCFLAHIPDEKRCQAVARHGGRCRNVAMVGATLCNKHGGYRALGVTPFHVIRGRLAKQRAAQMLRDAGQAWVLTVPAFRVSSAKDRMAVALVAGDEGELRLELAAVVAKLKARGWNV